MAGHFNAVVMLGPERSEVIRVSMLFPSGRPANGPEETITGIMLLARMLAQPGLIADASLRAAWLALERSF